MRPPRLLALAGVLAVVVPASAHAAPLPPAAPAPTAYNGFADACWDDGYGDYKQIKERHPDWIGHPLRYVATVSDGSGESPASDEASATPTRPQSDVAWAGTSAYVKVDTQPGARVYRAVDVSGSFGLLGTADAGGVLYDCGQDARLGVVPPEPSSEPGEPPPAPDTGIDKSADSDAFAGGVKLSFFVALAGSAAFAGVAFFRRVIGG